MPDNANSKLQAQRGRYATNGRTGYCQDIWKDRVIDRLWEVRLAPENTHVFLCRNPTMIEDMLGLLADDGFRKHTNRVPGEVHMEKYW